MNHESRFDMNQDSECVVLACSLLETKEKHLNVCKYWQ